MKNEQEDIYNIQPNGEETNKENSPLIEHEKIEGTPFTITGSPTKGYFLRIGDYRLTNMGLSKRSIIKQMEEEQWNIILKMIAVVIDREAQLQISKNTK